MRVVLAVALFFVVTASASARLVIRHEDGSPAPVLQAWVDASHVPVAHGVVTIHLGNCFGEEQPTSCTAPPGDDIWLREPVQTLRYALTHELGHRFDYRVMNEPARAAFRRIIDDRRPWRARGGNSPHEQFAEAYGLCMRHRRVRGAAVIGSYGYLVTTAKHHRVCRLIQETATACRRDEPGQASGGAGANGRVRTPKKSPPGADRTGSACT